MARKGYALNKMCFSFNSADNRAEFKADPAAYCDKWGLNAQQKAAVLSLQVLDMLAAGGNAYYLAKLGGIYGWTCRTSARSRPASPRMNSRRS
jgi:protocatechuate 4,5-dioxygenase alpha chain